jgi:tetratricopeptide (TPR) repeat protein
MALFKCKMCGGSLEIAAGTTVIECEYCGTQQTLPKLDDDKRANMYDRANHFRRNNEFDKAMGIYEQILNEDNTDAEAYWSLVLCRYGIEYVEDPSTKRRIPTVNRAQFTSIFDDEDYKSALKNADTTQRSVYEAEAKAINEIQKGILAISQKEEPFDVFICYKETDNNGRRTPDSVLAQELYFGLKNEGFKVFFARITLEDKLGSAYEPYIFAALNSAKVMVVLGTKPEFFSAVWVKNEWSRYLVLIKQGQKKMLIPAYKDMDPYDLPEEFSHLQAQDMSKLGFMQDLIRGIKKIVKADETKPTVVKETVVKETVSAGAANTAPLLKRAFIFLEDGDWDSANEYCEKVLDMDPENAQAYVGKLMAGLRVKNQKALKNCAEPFDNNNNYQKAIRFADDTLKSELKGYIEHINTRNENARLEGIYTQAKNAMNSAKTEQDFKEARKLFISIDTYKDSASLRDVCYEKAEIARKDAIYNSAKGHMVSRKLESYDKAISAFAAIPGWKDADELRERCKKEREVLEQKEKEIKAEKQRQEILAQQQRERQAEEKRQEELRKAKAKRVCKVFYWIFVIFAIAINFVFERIAIIGSTFLATLPAWIAVSVMLVLTALFSRIAFKDPGYGFLVMILEVLAILIFSFVFSIKIEKNPILGLISCAIEYVVPVVVVGFISLGAIVFKDE